MGLHKHEIQQKCVSEVVGTAAHTRYCYMRPEGLFRKCLKSTEMRGVALLTVCHQNPHTRFVYFRFFARDA